MRIDTVASLFQMKPPAQNPGRALAATASEASPVAKPDDGIKVMDFTHMSRQEMRDWLNQQIRSGAMTLDESSPFMAMTMQLDANSGLDTGLGRNDPRGDFTQKVRDGITAARQRHDGTTLHMLESAMRTMQRYQGQTMGVDVHA